MSGTSLLQLWLYFPVFFLVRFSFFDFGSNPWRTATKNLHVGSRLVVAAKLPDTRTLALALAHAHAQNPLLIMHNACVCVRCAEGGCFGVFSISTLRETTLVLRIFYVLAVAVPVEVAVATSKFISCFRWWLFLEGGCHVALAAPRKLRNAVTPGWVFGESHWRFRKFVADILWHGLGVVPAEGAGEELRIGENYCRKWNVTF